MGHPGRPRKQQPYKPGAPVPIAAAACGPERRLGVAKPKRQATPLKLTLGNGYRQDDIAIWRRRTKKGSDETVIDARQYVAGRRIQDMTQTIMDDRGLKAFDMTVPVVDTSHSPRWGGYGPEARAEHERFDRLGKHLGPRDLQFLMSFLGGMGVHGAMLNEAGLEWRCPPDRDIDQRTCAVDAKTGKVDLKTGDTDVGHASSILPAGTAYRIELDLENGGFVVDARSTRRDDEEYRPSANAAARRAVSDKKLDGNPAELVEVIEVAARAMESRRHPDDEIDPDVEAMREMHRVDPPPASPDMDGDVLAIGVVIDIGDIEHFHPWTTVDRAKEVFTTRQIELASVRCRNLLNDAANFFEADDARRHDTTAVIIPVALISPPDDIQFDVGIVREYETVDRT
jgi:hypothetical protein